MDAPVEITEVIGRAEQGMTRPFICRAGVSTYFVKGAGAGKRSLCCEWVAGNLVKRLLPSLLLRVPEIALGCVSRGLVDGSARKDIRDLGAGLVFASMQIRDGRELSWSDSGGWPVETMAMLLLLDLWLQNEDRSLSALGGNPNLLVTQLPMGRDERGASWQGQHRQEILWAYDFNLAFDPQFDRQRFFQSHVFGNRLQQWPEGFRERMEPRMQNALDGVRDLFAELPVEWLFPDGDETLAVQLDEEWVCSVLRLPFTDGDAFWSLP